MELEDLKEMKAGDALDKMLDESPVMNAYMSGIGAAGTRLMLWARNCPAEDMIPECPYNPETQEALSYAWRAGALMACAQSIETLYAEAMKEKQEILQ